MAVEQGVDRVAGGHGGLGAGRAHREGAGGIGEADGFDQSAPVSQRNAQRPAEGIACTGGIHNFCGVGGNHDIV